MDIEKVLEEYREGDEGKRLSLFLGFGNCGSCSAALRTRARPMISGSSASPGTGSIALRAPHSGS